MRKVLEDKCREWLSDICSFIEIIGVNHEKVVKAITMKKFKDFEDCLQDENAGARFIITRNIADFDNSKVSAISLEIFLENLKYIDGYK